MLYSDLIQHSLQPALTETIVKEDESLYKKRWR